MTDRDETLIRAARGALASGALTFKAETVRILIGVIDGQEDQLSRTKNAFLHAGVADWTDNVAEMAETCLGREKE